MEKATPQPKPKKAGARNTKGDNPLSVVYTFNHPLYHNKLLGSSKIQIQVLLYLFKDRSNITAYLWGYQNGHGGVNVYQQCQKLEAAGLLVRDNGSFSLSPDGRAQVRDLLDQFRSF